MAWAGCAVGAMPARGCEPSNGRATLRPPAAEPLAKQPMPQLAAALRRRKNAILRRWIAAVERHLPNADDLTLTQVRDTIPVILDHLAAALESASPEDTERLATASGWHGSTRHVQSYVVREVVAEYRMLRPILLDEVWEAFGRQMDLDAIVALNAAVDIPLEQSVVTYTEAEDAKQRRANEAEANYLSFLSHDLRNSINNAAIIMEWVAQRLVGLEGFEEERSDLLSARQAAHDTIAGMNRLLQAEKIRRTAELRKPELVSLRLVASAVVQQFEQQARDKGLSIEVDVPPSAHVRSDRALIGLVLQNLLSNALKFSSNPPVRIHWEKLEQCPEKWALSVSDRGPGIAPDQLGKLFTAFERGEGAGPSGLGLGLTIASEAARTLGASLSVRSEPGKGSTFSLCLAPDH